MRLPWTTRKIFLPIIIIVVIITLTAIFVFASMSKWEQEMIERNMSVCETYSRGLLSASAGDIDYLGAKGLLNSSDMSSAEMKMADSLLKRNSDKHLMGHEGLDGGFYLRSHDAFFGYAFPTSPPPVPAYGPPPRSYEIIKSQALSSVEDNTLYCQLHGFDAAIFPLATVPVTYNDEVIGAVWVRIHLEKHLPVVKIKQIVNRTALISIAGFIILIIISTLWNGEMKGLKREIINIRKNPGYRLNSRWGIFGYISDSVNEMLDTIESEHNKRQALEKQLHQKEKMAYLGNMVAGVAHEVKTPLSIIKTRMQLWQKDILGGRNNGNISQESLQMVINETNRLSALVNRLLVFASPIDKKIKPTNINLLIDEVVRLMDTDPENKSVVIDFKAGSGIPRVPLDPSSLQQVLINVLKNSIDSTKGEGLIAVTTSLEEEGKKVRIEVSDSGEGIPEKSLENIFEPFYTLKESGVGLGLAISYQIVKAHNGDIVIQNNPGKGVKCTIRLPLEK